MKNVRLSPAARREENWGRIMVSPTIIRLIVLNLWPFVQTIYTSFCEHEGFGRYSFIGLQNYIDMFQNADLSSLIQCGDRSFSPNPNETGASRTYSLDVMPQEYSTCGVGDFRLPSIELELPNGSHTCDLRFCGFQVQKGKYALEGLPAFFGSEAEAETLIVHLTDTAAQVVVSLYFGVFEELDLITRAVKVKNAGAETVRLCRCASLCLDFLRSDMDLITFNGHHLMERCLDRGALRPGVQSVGSVRGRPATSTTLS